MTHLISISILHLKKKARKKVWCLTLPDGEILSTTTVTKDYAEGQQLRSDKNEHVHTNHSKSFRARVFRVFCSKGSSSGDWTIHPWYVLEHKENSTGQGGKQMLWKPLKKISLMVGTSVSVCPVNNNAIKMIYMGSSNKYIVWHVQCQSIHICDYDILSNQHNTYKLQVWLVSTEKQGLELYTSQTWSNGISGHDLYHR